VEGEHIMLIDFYKHGVFGCVNVDYTISQCDANQKRNYCFVPMEELTRVLLPFFKEDNATWYPTAYKFRTLKRNNV
jgi:hypothetical protein